MLLDKIWVIYRGNSLEAKKEALICKENLIAKKIDVTTAISDRKTNLLQEFLSEETQLPNLVIVLGGDGTVLRAASHLSKYHIPILSFNVGGSLGFLTHDHSRLRYKDLWEKLLDDCFAIDQRMMLEAKVQRNPSNKSKERSESLFKGNISNNCFLALNDFYIRSSNDDFSTTCNLGLEIDSEVVDQYRGDGLILSTPTGSTAYSMASGGPILHPGIESIIVNPICPMSLSSRSIIVPAGSRLVIKTLGEANRKMQLWQDGASCTLLETGDSCIVQRARHNALMVVLEQSRSYYRTLTNKLHWAGSLLKSQERFDPSNGN